jgi:hypothetical protein
VNILIVVTSTFAKSSNLKITEPTKT